MHWLDARELNSHAASNVLGDVKMEVTLRIPGKIRCLRHEGLALRQAAALIAACQNLMCMPSSMHVFLGQPPIASFLLCSKQMSQTTDQ